MNNPSNTQSKPNNKYCSICDKVFSTTINLRNHKLTVHEKKFPYKCPYQNCDKQYSIAARLKVHLRSHLGEKPFQCDICLKTFREKGNLKTHKKFHSALRPFKCPQCEKTYKTNGHLKDHIEIQHKNIKRFKCELCGNFFGRSSTLKAHIRTHTGEKTIKCLIEGCNKYFAEKGNMLIHYRRHKQRIEESNIKKESEDISGAITRPCSNSTLVETIPIQNNHRYVIINMNSNEDCKYTPIDLDSPKEEGENELEKQFNLNI